MSLGFVCEDLCRAKRMLLLPQGWWQWDAYQNIVGRVFAGALGDMLVWRRSLGLGAREAAPGADVEQVFCGCETI